jgi:hypothetical protein
MSGILHGMARPPAGYICADMGGHWIGGVSVLINPFG